MTTITEPVPAAGGKTVAGTPGGPSAEPTTEVTEAVEPAAEAVAEAADVTAEEVTCETCRFAKANGWWGDIAPARTHCRGCHRFWGNSKVSPGPNARRGGLREAHCTVCHEHFKTPEAFDYHLSKDGCVPPATVTRRDGKQRLEQRESRWGPIWAIVYYGERPSFWRYDDDDDGEKSPAA